MNKVSTSPVPIVPEGGITMSRIGSQYFSLMRVTGFVKDNTVDADVLRAVEPMISPVVISRVLFDVECVVVNELLVLFV